MKLLEIKTELNSIAKAIERLCGKLDSSIDEDKQKPQLIFFPTKKEVESTQKIAPIQKEKEQEEMKYHGITIQKNKKCKTYYTRYRKDGKQYYISGKTQKQVLEELKYQLDIPQKTLLKGITLEDWYNKWLNTYKIGNVRETTIKDYYKTFKNIPANLLDKPIKSITEIEIATLLQNINAERTKQKVYELLYMLFEKATTTGKIKRNVIKELTKPKHTRQKGIALNLEEQNKLINSCNDKYGDMCKILLYQGMRIGELLALTGADINIKNKTITINKALVDNNKIGETKNNTSNRIIPIFDFAINTLKKYAKSNNNRIFDITYNIARKHFKKILTNANLSNDISIHDLRHTFVTNCKNVGIPEHVIQTWIGHEIGSKVTSTIYTHKTTDDNLFINRLNESKFYSNSTHK